MYNNSILTENDNKMGHCPFPDTEMTGTTCFVSIQVVKDFSQNRVTAFKLPAGNDSQPVVILSQM